MKSLREKSLEPYRIAVPYYINTGNKKADYREYCSNIKKRRKKKKR